ncbi:2OG-Fe(II) oxygenase [Sphingomonas lutea]|uniref:2OG-Fe(II) oxygenase n=1 Tax=Sphingomonas lutea TaxID=1045317 RepID=A0A7G9SG42_9SPHN|nr:2OG-Fe(II) oxygenase [Sphingomonas lutea]QNN66817.1 2OG-Fe(II) oxygenase [Sphingomonas lutea]
MNQELKQAIARFEAGDGANAVETIRRIASAGDPDALNALGILTWSGNQVASDPPRGRLLFQYAASLGNAQAALTTTNLMASGIAGERNWPMAFERLEDEARLIPQRRRALDLIRRMALDANGDPADAADGESLSDRPEARLFRQLLTPDECTYLIDIASPGYQPSTVYNTARELVRDTIRTSHGSTIYWLIEDPAVHAINRRIAAITGTRFDQGEALQALRYAPGQEYRPHFDFVEGADNPRIFTALIYLNDDYDGGETAFVRTGLKVRGRLGDVLLFRNTGDGDAPEPLSEHAGLPVTAGTKFLATRWIRRNRWVP